MQNNLDLRRRPHNSGQILALSFAAVILMGTILLSLPIASSSKHTISVTDALFTATSAVCVTGLSVINVSEELSLFGQITLMCLIQVGGLGFLTFTSLLIIMAGKRISLRDRLVLRDSMNVEPLGDLTGLIRWIIAITLLLEFIGASLLSIHFIPAYGLGKGSFLSVFHAVSAFCNAGFDLIGADSLLPYQNDPLVQIVLSFLIICGGMGFVVFRDLWKNRRFSRTTLQTRIVLVATGALIFVGWLSVMLLEWNNPATLGNLSPASRALNAFFESVTLRTAGFATFSQAGMRSSTRLISMLLMFIGAAPASTGGGVKLTTFTALLLLIITISRGRERAVFFQRTLKRTQMERAMCVFLIALGLILFDAFLLSLTEPSLPFEDILFESISAFATVGLSCGVTGVLSNPGRLIMIVTMFIGRVGPLTLALAIARRQSAAEDKVRYPEEDIMIG